MVAEAFSASLLHWTTCTGAQRFSVESTYLLCQHVVLPFHCARLKIGSEKFWQAACLQESVSAAGFAAILNASRGDSCAHALEARAGSVELLERIAHTSLPCQLRQACTVDANKMPSLCEYVHSICLKQLS